jgi:hypothetical protein
MAPPGAPVKPGDVRFGHQFQIALAERLAGARWFLWGVNRERARPSIEAARRVARPTAARRGDPEASKIQPQESPQSLPRRSAKAGLVEESRLKDSACCECFVGHRFSGAGLSARSYFTASAFVRYSIWRWSLDMFDNDHFLCGRFRCKPKA